MKIASQIFKKNYCQFWFKFSFIPIMLVLSSLLLHFQEETEAATKDVL